MTYQYLSKSEMENHFVGEGITLAAVMAVVAIAVMAVVIYKLFMSEKGSTSIPGGWKFSWQ